MYLLVQGFLPFPETFSRLRMCDLVGAEIEAKSGEPFYCSTEIIRICMKFLPRCGKSVTDSR